MQLGFTVLAAAVSSALVNPAAAPVGDATTESRHGITTTDQYRWMEDPARAAELSTYVRAASEATISQLRKLPRHAEFTRLLEEASRAGVRFTDVRAVDDRVFYRRLDPADRIARLMMREGQNERLLFDPGANGANASIGAWSVAPGGRTLALHVSEKGSEQGAVRFLDVASGREVRPRIEPIWGEFEVSWLTPSRITFTRMMPGATDRMLGMRAFVADLNGTSETAVLGAGVTSGPSMIPSEFPLIVAEPDTDWILGGAVNARADQRYFVARRDAVATGQPKWQQLAGLDDRVSSVSLQGDYAYLLSTRGASNGRIERRDLASGKTEIVTIPTGLILTDVRAATDGVYIVARADGAGRLLFVPAGTTRARALDLPFEADFTSLRRSEDARGIVFTLMGWTTAPRSFRAVDGVVTSLGLDSVGWAPAKQFVVSRHEAKSADGTLVPMVIVAPSAKGPWPSILEGYGSYGVASTTPWYNINLLAWTGSGGATAFCGTRGGNERGRDWHEGGRAGNKPNAHADYIACAEKLVALGAARPGGIGAMGTSAGGMLAPLAVQKRPELFGALLPRVAMLNASRLEASENGANQYSEMGDPSTPEGYRGLVAADATLALEQAKGLPDTLVTFGLNDRRVAPWMGAKFASVARQRFGDTSLILVRADTEAGHGVGSTRGVLISEWADVFAFMADRLSVNAR